MVKRTATDRQMIALKVNFWTNNIAAGPQKIEPGHGWTSGTVRVEANTRHRIRSGKAVPFNSLLKLPAAIEQVLEQHRIKLHISERQSRYLVAAPRAARGGRSKP
jgi:hypothetical protein